MKNQTAKFTSATDSTLVVSLHRGKQDWKAWARLRTPGERPKVKTGCKSYFAFADEAKAQAAFDRLVKDAIAAGWTLKERGERAAAFTAVPQAPGVKKPAITGGQISTAPRAAMR